jgi:hypothetical protein
MVQQQTALAAGGRAAWEGVLLLLLLVQAGEGMVQHLLLLKSQRLLGPVRCPCCYVLHGDDGEDVCE